jgi:hypothetical protein
MPKHSTIDPMTFRIPDVTDQTIAHWPVFANAQLRDLQRLQTEWAALPSRQRARGASSLERRAHNDRLARTRGELRVAIERAEFALANALATQAPRTREHFGETLPTEFEQLVLARARLMHTTLETAAVPKSTRQRRVTRMLEHGHTIVGRTPDALEHARAKTHMRENTHAILACLLFALDAHTLLAQLAPTIERLRVTQRPR